MYMHLFRMGWGGGGTANYTRILRFDNVICFPEMLVLIVLLMHVHIVNYFSLST